MTEQSLDESSGVTLRPVQPGDEDFLLDVYASTRADELALVPWDEEQKRAFVRQQFGAQHTQYCARFPDAEYSVILYGNRPVGRTWIGREPEEIRLLDIAILPEFQNRGIGAALLNSLIAESEKTGVPLRHMVFKMNTDALRFYERFGFKQFEDVGAYLHVERLPATAAERAPAATASTD